MFGIVTFHDGNTSLTEMSDGVFQGASPNWDLEIVLDSASEELQQSQDFTLVSTGQHPLITSAGRPIVEILRNDDVKDINNLVGRFAFAYAQGKQLFLVRDHLGIVPLYYCRPAIGKIAFATNILHILRLFPSFRKVNRAVLQCIQGIGFNLFPGESIFEGINMVSPGEIVRFSSTGVSRSLYRKEMIADSLGQRNIDRIHEILNHGLRICFENTTTSKNGLFLSGGLDSSYLLCQGLNYCDLIPFSMWDGKNNDDIKDARTIASEMGVELHEVVPTVSEVDNMIVDYAWHYAVPMGGGGFDLLGGVAFHLLANRMGRQGIKIAFCGEGADEYFLGYHQYHMVPEILVNKIETAIRQHKLDILEARLSELGLPANPSSSLRSMAGTYGLSEYHLPSVFYSGIASSIDIVPPFVYPPLEEILRHTSSESLIDRHDYWTKKLLRDFFTKLMPNTSSRAAVRRKRSMTYSLSKYHAELAAILKRSSTRLSLEEACWRLFFFLHVRNNFSQKPEASLTDLIPDLEQMDFDE